MNWKYLKQQRQDQKYRSPNFRGMITCWTRLNDLSIEHEERSRRIDTPVKKELEFVQLGYLERQWGFRARESAYAAEITETSWAKVEDGVEGGQCQIGGVDARQYMVGAVCSDAYETDNIPQLISNYLIIDSVGTEI